MPLTDLQISHRQLAIGLVAGLICGALVIAAQIGGTFDAFELRLLDARFRLRGERPAVDGIALVSIDDETIRAYGGWPLPRDSYALLLNAIAGAGAQAIGVDLQLPEDANHDPRANALLAFVSATHPNVVHAISFIADGAPAPTMPAALEALRRQGIDDPRVGVAVASGVSLPFTELLEEAVPLGHITVAADRDGAIRRQPFMVRYGDRVYPSLALRMVGVGAGHAGPPRAASAPGGLRVEWDGGPRWLLPLDREGTTALDFAGDRHAFPRAYSMIEVLRSVQAGDTTRLRERFGGRHVVIGLDSRTEVTEDVGTTPFATATPLVFVHANAIDNLLRGRFLRRLPPAFHYAALGIVALGLGGLFGVLPMATAALVAGASVGALAGLDFALFALGGIDAPPLAALILVPILYAAVTSGRYLFLETRTRQREVEIREGRSVEQQFLPEALIGRDLSRYHVVEKIGSGGMGVVYRGRDSRLGRDVAIKVLPARALADERARRRFRREAMALSTLSHPRIAGIYDFDSQDGIDFLVMELVSGSPLSERLRRGPLPEADVLRLTAQVAEALESAHGRGVVHRDLKPENLMLVDEGNVKILDFGVARFLNAESESGTRAQSLTETGHIVGTLPYMAPEVICGVKTDPRSDLYSLGVVAFEMATGRRPFPNDEPHELMYTILNQAPPSPRILNGRISERLDAAILRLLDKRPEERFASATELLGTLNSITSSAAEGAGPHSTPHTERTSV